MNRHIFNIMMWLIACVMLTGCDVHEFPDLSDREPVQLKISLDYNLELPPYKDIIYESGGTRFEPSDLYDIRYVINIYRSDNPDKFTREPYMSLTQSKNNLENLNHEFYVDVPPGYYKIMVWSDYTKAGSIDDRYYSTFDFSNIFLMGNHTGCDDYRDAFRGEAVAYTSHRGDSDNAVTVEMRRPMAKYKFVSTDFDKFFTRAEEEARSRMMQEGIAFLPKQKSEVGDTRSELVNLDDFKVRFRYTGFMPNIYNMFTDKPSDATTGISYYGTINKISETEAELGFDYVFVNGQEALVQVSVEIYGPEGKLMSSSGAINVPLVRSMVTTVRGEFLTSKTAGGVGISSEFEGEFNIVVP